MKLQLLALAAVMALYAQWRFASPFLPSPTLRSERALVRHTPLILFSSAGALLAVALPNFGYIPFVISLSASVAMMLVGLASRIGSRHKQSVRFGPIADVGKRAKLPPSIGKAKHEHRAAN